MMKKIYLLSCLALCVSQIAQAIELTDSKLDWAARSRYAEYQGDEFARAASLLLRVNASAEWDDRWIAQLQLDNVSRAFKNEHSDGVSLNGKPIIADAEGFDINQALVGMKLDSSKILVGRQRINLDDQRFVGGSGFWQNEQTFDALSYSGSLLTNSRFFYAYVEKVNRIFGKDADKYLHPGDVSYSGPDSERPAGLLGEHRHQTHLLQFNLNEWDYSQWSVYAFAIKNLTQPSASNNSLGTNYSFTYKADSVQYHLKLESAFQKQTEISSSPVLPFYLIEANVGINTWQFNSRYEVVGSKQGLNFIAPLASNHDFQGLANEATKYSNNGLRDASLGFTWRATPFKIETQYHQFFNDTEKKYLAQELDCVLSYKPNRKHSVSLLTAFFKPESNTLPKSSTRKIYLDYSYNF